MNPVHTILLYSVRSFLIFPSHLRLALPSGLFNSRCPAKTFYIPRAICVTVSAHFILDFITLIHVLICSEALHWECLSYRLLFFPFLVQIFFSAPCFQPLSLYIPLSVLPIQNNKRKCNSVRLNITVFRDITPRPSRSSSPRRSLSLLNPTDGKTTGFEKVVNIYQSTRNLIPKDLNLHQHRCEKLESRILCFNLHASR